MDEHRKSFYLGDLEITCREIIASISIVAIMLFVGVLIFGRMSEWQSEQNEIYNKAVKIESKDLFQYGMNTNVGNAFVYGVLKAVDTVTYPEIQGQYMYLQKVKEKYTMHTRTVTKTRIVNGKSQTYTTTETYWTWDRVGSEELWCEEIMFCGILFGSNKINFPPESHIGTIRESANIRYKYYGVGTEHTGTIFTELKNKTISDNSDFYNGKNIEETMEVLEMSDTVLKIGFWICWIGLTTACVIGFYYLDNEWLE